MKTRFTARDWFLYWCLWGNLFAAIAIGIQHAEWGPMQGYWIPIYAATLATVGFHVRKKRVRK
jgi:hypothetical protein